jgi:cardiolipin synthase
LIGMTPLWLVALVVARDLAIACGWLAIKLFSLPIATQPLFVGKASTLVQVLYIFATLLLLAFDLSAPRLTQLAAWACGLLTVLSAAAYGGLFLRGILTGNRVA